MTEKCGMLVPKFCCMFNCNECDAKDGVKLPDKDLLKSEGGYSVVKVSSPTTAAKLRVLEKHFVVDHAKWLWLQVCVFCVCDVYCYLLLIPPTTVTTGDALHGQTEVVNCEAHAT